MGGGYCGLFKVLFHLYMQAKSMVPTHSYKSEMQLQRERPASVMFKTTEQVLLIFPVTQKLNMAHISGKPHMKCGEKMFSGFNLKTRLRVNTIPHYRVPQQNKVTMNIYMPIIK